MAGPLFRKKYGAPNRPYVPPYPGCLHPTRTVVIIDILLRTRAAMLQCTLLLQHEIIFCAFVGASFLWGPLFGRTC